MEEITIIDGEVVFQPQLIINLENIGEVKSMQQKDSLLPREEGEKNLNLINSAYGKPTFSEDFLPTVYFVEPTNECNLNCVICPNSKLCNNKLYMDFNLFKKLIDEIGQSAKLIKLNYRGEPLLHPKICEMIQYCKDNTFARISLSTNGTLMDKKLSQKLIIAGIDEIIFSLDANSPKTYKKIKGGNEFKNIVKNVENFLKMSTNNDIRTIVRLTQMHANRNEIEPFKKRWSKYDCEVKISWVSTWANNLPNNKVLSDYLCPYIGKPKMPCADLWYKMVITADGLVPLCCYDFSVKYPLGKINTSSIRDIWNNNENVKLFRKIHSEYRFNQMEMCKNCEEYSRTQDVLDYLNIKEFPLGRP